MVLECLWKLRKIQSIKEGVSWSSWHPLFFRFFMIFFSSFSSSDFTDESEGIPAEAITHGFSRIFGLWPMAGARNMLLLFFVTQISQMTQIFLCGRVLSHRFHRYTQIFYGISVESLFPTSGGICTDRTGRLRENPWVIASSGKPPNKFRVIRWIKKSASSAKSAWQKTSPDNSA